MGLAGVKQTARRSRLASQTLLTDASTNAISRSGAAAGCRVTHANWNGLNQCPHCRPTQLRVLRDGVAQLRPVIALFVRACPVG